MKTAVIIRIIIWSAVAILLLVVLIMGLTGRFSPFRGFSFGSQVFSFPGGNSDYTVSSNASVNASGITKIEVNWVSGTVKVVPYDGNEIKFSEEAPGNIKEEEKMRYRVSNGSTLKIHFCADNYVSLNSLNKVLTLQVPKAYAGAFDLDNVSSQVDISGLTLTDLEVDSVSGHIILSDLAATEADICTVSGPVDATGCSFVKADTDTTSGSVMLRGTFTECKLNSVSGELYLESDVCPATIDMDTISGKSTIAIPENDGFTVKQDSISGDLDCEFELKMSSNRLVHKNGAADFSVNSVSGSLSIQKYEPAA